MSSTMNAVVCITDKNYLLPTKVLIGSLSKHLGDDVHVFVLSKDVKLDDFQDFPAGESVREVIDYSHRSIFGKVSRKSFAGKTHVTPDAMAKLQIPFMFSKYERVLYLDVDMICCSSELNSLFDLDLKGKAIAAVPDYKIAFHPFGQTLGIREGTPYFNSGLVLFDIPACRALLTESLVIDRVEAIADRVRFVDQDTLNYLYRGQVHHLPLRFNVFANVHIGNDVTRPLHEVEAATNSGFMAFSNEQLLSAMSQRVVLHFTSSAKPWKKTCGDDALWFRECRDAGLPFQASDRPKGALPKKTARRGAGKPIRRLLVGAGKKALNSIAGPQLKKLHSTLKSLEQRQQQVLQEVESLRSDTITYPVAIDLRWITSERALSEELTELFQKNQFRASVQVVLNERFQEQLAPLSQIWSLPFLTEFQSGTFFSSKRFRPDSGARLGQYLQLLRGESPQPHEPEFHTLDGHWMRKNPDGSSEALSSEAMPQSGPSLLHEYASPRYDALIVEFYKRRVPREVSNS